MNLLALLALLTISITDPAGDAIGDGTLEPPTSPLYANVAVFDLQAVELEVADSGRAVLSVTLGSLGAAVSTDTSEVSQGAGDGSDGPDATDEEQARELLATQFDVSALLAVVDVYLDIGDGGADQTLRGPNLLLPTGSGWRHAVRLSSEGAWGITYTGQTGSPPVASGPADTDIAMWEPNLTHVPLSIERAGNVLSMALPWQLDPDARIGIYAMSGVHDPFSADAWRSISQGSSPWAFSGGEQVTPVIDMLAPDSDAQTAALRSGVLPSPARGPDLLLPLSPWLWLMVAGVAVAVLGLVLRGRVARPQVAAAVADDEADADEERAESGDAGDQGDDGIDVLSTLLPFEADSEGGSDPEPDLAPDTALEAEPDAVVEVGTDTALEAEPYALLEAEPDAAVEGTAEELAEAGNLTGDPAGLVISGPEASDETPEDGHVLVPSDDDQVASEPTDRSAFSTTVENSYLSSGNDGFGHENFGNEPDSDGESFWHPATRSTTTQLKRTLVNRVIAAAEEPAAEPESSEPPA